jgi:hypothetical protein
MPTLRISISETTVYEGTSDAVPRVGDRIRHGDKTLRVESVVWEVPNGGGDLAATVEVEDESYRF